MAEKVRIGVIGVGQIGKHHLYNYQNIPDAEIVAVADVNQAEAERVAAEFKIPHVYGDFRQLLVRDDLHAVDVAVHNNLHSPITIAALQAGKHVYCEKPMAGAYVDAEKMLAAARECQRHLSIQFFSLFTNEIKAAKQLVDAGKLGKLYHARSTGHRRRGRPYVDGYGTPMFVQKEQASGGALYDMGVYHITQMLYLLGNPAPRTITGSIHQEVAMDEARRAKSGYNVEELSLGFVRFEGGITLDIIEAWAIHADRFEGSAVYGSEGGVRLDPFGYFFSVADLDINGAADLESFQVRTHRLDPNADAYDSAQQHWVAALQGRVPLLPTAEMALTTMLISEGIYLAHHLGREVTAEEVMAASKSTAKQA
jgi:predicted dehydrogenase